MSTSQSETVLQFHLRGLFMASALVAAVCGALAPAVHEDQRRLGLLVAAAVGALLGCGGLATVICWTRWRIERDAGPLQRRVRSAPRSVARFYCFWGLYALAAAAGVALTLWGSLTEWTRATSPLNIIAMLLPSSMLLTPGVVALWWGPNATLLEARQHGLLLRSLDFYRWEGVRCRWGQRPNELLVVAQKLQIFSVLLADGERPHWEQLLAEHGALQLASSDKHRAMP